MKMYRQEILLFKLLRFRWKKYSFDHIKVECYDRFDGDNYMCRVEVFRGGKGIRDRIFKHEAQLTDDFVIDLENQLVEVVENFS